MTGDQVIVAAEAIRNAYPTELARGTLEDYINRAKTVTYPTELYISYYGDPVPGSDTEYELSLGTGTFVDSHSINDLASRTQHPFEITTEDGSTYTLRAVRVHPNFAGFEVPQGRPPFQLVYRLVGLVKESI